MTYIISHHLSRTATKEFYTYSLVQIFVQILARPSKFVFEAEIDGLDFIDLFCEFI